jgi:hypothetical protein
LLAIELLGLKNYDLLPQILQTFLLVLSRDTSPSEQSANRRLLTIERMWRINRSRVLNALQFYILCDAINELLQTFAGLLWLLCTVYLAVQMLDILYLVW